MEYLHQIPPPQNSEKPKEQEAEGMRETDGMENTRRTRFSKITELTHMNSQRWRQHTQGLLGSAPGLLCIPYSFQFSSLIELLDVWMIRSRNLCAFYWSSFIFLLAWLLVNFYGIFMVFYFLMLIPLRSLLFSYETQKGSVSRWERRQGGITRVEEGETVFR